MRSWKLFLYLFPSTYGKIENACASRLVGKYFEFDSSALFTYYAIPVLGNWFSNWNEQSTPITGKDYVHAKCSSTTQLHLLFPRDWESASVKQGCSVFTKWNELLGCCQNAESTRIYHVKRWEILVNSAFWQHPNYNAGNRFFRFFRFVKLT